MNAAKAEPVLAVVDAQPGNSAVVRTVNPQAAVTVRPADNENGRGTLSGGRFADGDVCRLLHAGDCREARSRIYRMRQAAAVERNPEVAFVTEDRARRSAPGSKSSTLSKCRCDRKSTG